MKVASSAIMYAIFEALRWVLTEVTDALTTGIPWIPIVLFPLDSRASYWSTIGPRPHVYRCSLLYCLDLLGVPRLSSRPKMRSEVTLGRQELPLSMEWVDGRTAGLLEILGIEGQIGWGYLLFMPLIFCAFSCLVAGLMVVGLTLAFGQAGSLQASWAEYMKSLAESTPATLSVAYSPMLDQSLH